MYKTLAILAIALLLVWGFACTRAGSGAHPPIDGAKARALVSEGAQLVDVRTVGEYGGGHIDGALNIPVQDLSKQMSKIGKDKPVVVYCQSGARSAKAANMLRSAGYSEVYDLGGISNW